MAKNSSRSLAFVVVGNVNDGVALEVPEAPAADELPGTSMGDEALAPETSYTEMTENTVPPLVNVQLRVCDTPVMFFATNSSASPSLVCVTLPVPTAEKVFVPSAQVGVEPVA